MADFYFEVGVMEAFWTILIVAELIMLSILIYHLRQVSGKKKRMEIISYRERLKFRRVVSFCTVFIIGGIISALIVYLDL